MKQNLLMLGIDVGTTSAKSIIFNTQGVVVGSSEMSYPTLSPQPAWSEQDPEVILQAVKNSIKQSLASSGVAPREIAAAGFSTAMHSLLAVTQTGKAITNSVIWSDNRSSEQVRKLKETKEALAFYMRTGTPIHTMSPLSKLLWMREHTPDIFNEAYKFISIKEYIWFHLFGEFVVDYSIASATGLFNLEKNDWDQDILLSIGLTKDKLSTLVPVTYKKDLPHSSLAEELGVNPTMPFIIGASDGVLANVGAGAGASDKTIITIGTSGAIRRTVDNPMTDPLQRTFCYALTENKWVIGGATNNGGNAFRWFRDEWAKGKSTIGDEPISEDLYEYLLQLASTSPAGAKGLIFLPFLNGERAPYWNPDARAGYIGMANHHTQADFVRSLLEGVIFSIYSVGTALQELGGPIKEIRASGGFARSELWLHILADVFGQSIEIPASYHASAFGAGIIALVGSGQLDHLEESDQWTTVTQTVEPDTHTHQSYAQIFEIYQSLYVALERPFQELAEIQKTYINQPYESSR
ncbi:gluconokinase [Alkalihalobacillus sp. NPDC078783]